MLHINGCYETSQWYVKRFFKPRGVEQAIKGMATSLKTTSGIWSVLI